MDLFDPSNLVKPRKILGKAKEQLAVLQRVYDELLGMETAFETGRFFKHAVLGGGFRYVLFSPLFGEDVQFD